MAAPHQITADQLADVMFWHSIVRRNDDGSRLSVKQACARTVPRLEPGAFYYHRKHYTETYREAARAIDVLSADEQLTSAARARALALIEGGSDSAASSLVRSILAAQPPAARDVTLIIEQFGDDDFGGGRIDPADDVVGRPDPEPQP